MEKHGFYCPHCEEKISDPSTDQVRFWCILEGHHFTVGTYVGLSSKMGIYGGLPENKHIELEEDACLNFFCPHEGCRHTLTAAYDAEFSEVHWFDDKCVKHMIAFHNTLGKEVTCILDIESGEVLASHGRDRFSSINRWQAYPEWR